VKLWNRYYTFYLMFLPVFVYFLLFSYIPLVRGFFISLQNFRLIGNRPFVGFSNYTVVAHDPVFWNVFKNTAIIGGGMLLLGFVAPIVVSLSLNEVSKTLFKKWTQMIIYLPHLFSWVVVGGIWIYLMSPDGGFVNTVLHVFGQKQPIAFFSESAYARSLLVFITTWKEMGYTCIIYLAAIASINPALYEAARMDGAGRWEQIRYVTLPQLIPTMKVVLLLNMMGVLRMFDQVVVLSNAAIAKNVDVLMTYIYSKGLLEFKMGTATAAGFIVLVATFLITFITRVVIRYDEE
jgi:putative aldouronate transport system permease protein